ncbi:acyl-CoA synthetase [Pseudomonas aeruginosa VRFPA09]|nr:acyl-CoA synthetase [Pseudomonas aeruginosa VRFPA09]
MNRENLKRLLAPRHLAFIGGRGMARALKRCAEGGFAGQLWLVNPQHAELEGVPCVASVADLPCGPDAAFVATNRELTLDAVAALAAKGAGGAICYASGFAETGEQGLALQRRLLAAAGEMALLGPNCYGLLDYLHGAALWPVAHGGRQVERGVAVLTQSGNFAYNLSMSDRSLPVAYMASVGNQAQLGIAELMDVLLDEPRVTAIGLHLEGLKNVPGFARAAYKALQKGVPVIALKTGVSEIGAALALSHTSSLAGSDALYDSLFERLGVIRVSGPVSFVETLKAAACGHLPGGPSLVALACSGGDAGLIADYAERNGLGLPSFDAGQRDELAGVLPDYANIANPLDFTTAIWGDAAALEEMLDSALRSPADAALLVLDYPGEETGERPQCDLLLQRYCAALKRHGKVGFIASAFPELLPARARELLHGEGVAALQGVEALGLRNEAALEAALFDMRESLARHAPQLVFERVLLERMAGAPLAELIVGVKREEGFGLALVIGAGGILVELLRDSRSLLLPTTDAAIRDALLSLRSAPLLSGFRGRPAVSMEALVAAIRAVAEFACEHAERLLELDVNPLLADAEGALAVDALIRLANG